MTTAAAQSYHLLDALTRQQHRGRGDTWSAARDRAAKLAGVKRSYAKRIWDRWQDMKDVSGEALLKLQAAYDAACEKHEKKAAENIAAMEALDALDQGRPMAAVHGRALGRPQNSEEVEKVK